ncbi:MAG: hypothetical protein AAF494_01650 [Pseudomonadota bacterium]
MIEVALIPPLVWLVYAKIGPVVRDGPGGNRNPLFVTLPSEVSPSGNDPRAVRVQEVGEWRFSKLLGCSIGLIAAFLVVFLYADTEGPNVWLGQMIITAIATIAGDALGYLVRTIDLAGHGAEILKAEQLELEAYPECEIRRMLAFQYRDLTEAELRKRLEDIEWLSRIMWWLADPWRMEEQ